MKDFITFVNLQIEVICFQTFVKNGGGLLVAGQAWAWAYYSGEWSSKVQFANGYPGNK
jgi:hypothetical protein